jgi:hypothetical protein
MPDHKHDIEDAARIRELRVRTPAVSPGTQSVRNWQLVKTGLTDAEDSGAAMRDFMNVEP